jgi:hypothetical protein
MISNNSGQPWGEPGWPLVRTNSQRSEHATVKHTLMSLATGRKSNRPVKSPEYQQVGPTGGVPPVGSCPDLDTLMEVRT